MAAQLPRGQSNFRQEQQKISKPTGSCDVVEHMTDAVIENTPSSDRLRVRIIIIIVFNIIPHYACFTLLQGYCPGKGGEGKEREGKAVLFCALPSFCFISIIYISFSVCIWHLANCLTFWKFGMSVSLFHFSRQCSD